MDGRCGRRTLAGEVTLKDVGLFSSVPVAMRLRPAEAGRGVVFVRTDVGGVEIPALVSRAVDQPRRTALAAAGRPEVTVETVEHVLSAVSGLGVTDVVIALDAAEVPSFDGSSLAFVEAIGRVGLVDLEGELEPLVVTERVEVLEGDSRVVVEPLAAGEGPSLSYDLDYGDHPVLKAGRAVYRGGVDDYGAEVAPARTFVLEAEAEALQAMGLGKHLTAATLVVFGVGGVLPPNELRFADEPVRHKLLDLMGDLSLAGRPIVGRVSAWKSGHALNRRMAGRLLEVFG
ncbi:UDP-3-O-acyl-N-acetylglucosamine deacetylase [Mucisphaera sp.]|uniref:UDP-3-O-acyl-N-acetylglucosamine deacetylase n=1 Tax=Mucisphaera sp. TaxID=2913024 RepID=UPI003D13FB18